MLKKALLFLLLAAMLLSLPSCSDGSHAEKTSDKDISAVAGDYYIDLSGLGMKLTVFLRIGSDGKFQFSNTTSFEVNKSAGTVEKSGGEYLMLYSSVNGEEKSISDGLTSKFVVTADGVLDFTVCERIYYGTASATTTSDEHPGEKLVAHPVTDDYRAPSGESEFTAGNYTAAHTGGDGTAYGYNVAFCEDNGYLIFCTYNENGRISFLSESGRYGVSTTQLALTPQGGNRISCDVLAADRLSVSVPFKDGTRIVLEFKKTSGRDLVMSLEGNGKKTGTNEVFTAGLNIYSDGSFETESNGYREGGLIEINSATGAFKIYPDHPTEHTRGVGQVANVPAGRIVYNGENKAGLSEFRIRTSDSLNRDKCDFTQR